MDQKNIFFLVIGLLILGTIATVFLRPNTDVSSTKYDAFAQCLASENLTMYGSVSCSYCKAEKDSFEGSFKYVPYVECTKDPDLCIAKEIQAYPTWIDKNGIKYVGAQGLERLSKISSCILPDE